ncbi:MAG: hypothetical protein JXA30_22815 [Deltaproteobacteria bacterium]|nr:hypothetical protein [Deltaproteobacteria bacterium]
MTVRVTLRVFSGRENPSWILDQATKDALVERIRVCQITPGSSIAATSDGLGYRGFMIETEDEPDLDSEMTVFEGRITAGAFTRSLQDRGRELERWLLNTGSHKIDLTTRKFVESELNRVEP